MAWSQVFHTTAIAGTSNGFTTGSIDTTGSDFLIIGFASVSSGTTISDSKGNTWNALTSYGGGFGPDRFYQFYYAENVTAGTGHTFTCTGTGNFPTMFIAGFSGGAVASSFNVENGFGDTFVGSIQPGSVTPSEDNCLVICGIAEDDSTPPGINQSFTILDTIVGGGAFGHTAGSLAYIIETTAVAKNPTWTFGASRAVSAIAVFKQAGGGGGGDTLFAGPGLRFM